jgi:GAF domain-containing protein
MNSEDLSVRMAILARDLRSGTNSPSTLQYIVDTAVELIEPAETASITLANKRGEVRSAATSSDRALRNDEIQQELNDGPCVAAALQQPVVHIRDVRSERRWPQWAERARDELGFGSGMCVRLFTHERGIGALNLFSSEPEQFGDEEEQEAVAVAAHAAVALAAAEDIEQLRTAITNRTVIGQATGLVMAQYGLTTLRAFEVLKRLSSEQNRKLARIAEDVVSDWDANPQQRER